MVLRVKLHGSGESGDAYRVNLPTYVLLHGNITHGYALVNVPDHVHELTSDDLEGETVEHTTDGDFYPVLSERNQTKVNRVFEIKYPKVDNPHKVEIV
jgi:hypothetical protein